MRPSATSVRGFVEQLQRWLEAVHEVRPEDARFYAREVGTVGRMLACDPAFKRMFAGQAAQAGQGGADAESALRLLAVFLGAVNEAAAGLPAGSTLLHAGLIAPGVAGAQDPDVEAAFRSHLVWSGRECDFPRAGVYYGLAPCRTHHTAAAGLLPRKGYVYTGGKTEVREGETLPLVYYAVRDPSAVRVVPVKGKGKPGDPAHVSLVFPLAGMEVVSRPAASAGGLTPEEAAALAEIRWEADRNSQGGFVVSIGLKKEREREFFEKVVLDPPVQKFSDLCGRIQDAGPRFDG